MIYIYDTFFLLLSLLRASQRDRALLDYVRTLEQERAMLKEQLISAQVMLQQHLSNAPTTKQGTDHGSMEPTLHTKQEPDDREIPLQVYD